MPWWSIRRTPSRTACMYALPLRRRRTRPTRGMAMPPRETVPSRAFLARGCSLLAACYLSGCSFAPPYKVPDNGKAPEQYKELGDWKVAQPQDAEPRGDWWTLYNDPELDALEDKILDSNLSLKAAFARLQQARAQYRI